MIYYCVFYWFTSMSEQGFGRSEVGLDEGIKGQRLIRKLRQMIDLSPNTTPTFLSWKFLRDDTVQFVDEGLEYQYYFAVNVDDPGGSVFLSVVRTLDKPMRHMSQLKAIESEINQQPDTKSSIINFELLDTIKRLN